MQSSTKGDKIQPAVRQRREHTRSRGGCTACKTRHTRCDQRKPICNNCLIGSRECKYEGPIEPIRDRRSQRVDLPGVQPTWRVVAEPLPRDETSLDPFKTLFADIPLPFRTRELLKHFFGMYRRQCNEPSSYFNVVAIANKDAISFRSLLLAATCHFCLANGSLDYFAATHFHNLSHCFQLIRERWLLKKRTNARLASFTACLALVEAYTPNIRGAASHLKGVLAMADAVVEGTEPVTPEDKEDIESMDQFVNITHHYCSAIVQTSPGASLAIMRRSTRARLHSILEGFCIASFLPFFSARVGLKIIDPLRCITALRRLSSYLSELLPLPYHVVAQSSELRLYVELARRDILTDDGCAALLDKSPNYTPSRSGFVVACGFYMWGINEVWSLEKLHKGGLMLHLLNTLKNDIDETRGALATDGLRKDFWLWKVSVVAYGIATMEKQWAAASIDDKDQLLPGLKTWFQRRLRLWSAASGVTEWSDAKLALENIVWLEKPGEKLMMEVWTEALFDIGDSLVCVEPA